MAEIIEGRTTTTITRRDGRRVVKLSARLDPGRLSSGEALAYLRDSVLPEIRQTYPTVVLATGGQIREQSKLGPPPFEREVTAAGSMPRTDDVTARASQSTPAMHSGDDVILGGYGRS